MQISSVALLFYSPTGTTKTILNAIIERMELKTITLYDLTLPKDRERSIQITEDLLIVGIPVHYSQVPRLVHPNIEKITGKNQPTFLVAVYGNVSAGFVLHQLKSAIEPQGFRVIGGASFVAEHSFSSVSFPIALGRPDNNDIEIARDLGLAIIEKVMKYNSIDLIPGPIFKIPTQSLPIPNTQIVKQIVNQPIIDKEICTNCKTCAKHCPTGAINPDSLLINEELCIRCAACVKNCPNHARRIEFLMIPPFFKKAQHTRREPRIYL